MVIVVMGVAGSGKTTVGRGVATRLGLPFLDADDYHSPEARRRMHQGIPLTAGDRGAWIERVRAAVAEHSDAVLACSALREVHRQRLASLGDVGFVYLEVPREELSRRLGNRPDHFFHGSLLEDQLATLEPPSPGEGVKTLDGSLSVDDLVERITADSLR